MSTTVSADDVKHVASLANIELTEAEVPRMAKDMSAILGYFAELNELNTDGVPAMAQVADVLGQSPAQHGETLRADQVKPSLDRGAVMAEAPETDGRFFKVPKVIER